MLRLWELGEGQQGGLKRAVLSAVVGVLFGMLPYFAVAQIILGLLSGNQESSFYLTWCAVALVGFLLRATLYSLALSQSHKATFAILKSIREKVLEKLPKMPLGTILDTSSGQMKQVIVDQVESMERPLAHLLPEMTANVLGPVCILIYLFVLDWRMALLSLVSIPVGMAFMMAVMAGYGKQYEGSVKTTQAMNSAIVEYIGGIEVIKALQPGQAVLLPASPTAYKANASYFYHWMKSCQMPVSLARAISPTTMITILPVGWLLYTGGSLPIETFITTIVLPLGIAGPLLAAMDFVDSLAKVGTIVGSVDAILNGAEQDHGETPAEFQGRGIQLSHVSFGYHADKEVLHDVSLSISAGHHDRLCGALRHRSKSTIAKLIAGFWDVTDGADHPGRAGLEAGPAEATLRPGGLCLPGQLPL
ncbi:MAG: ABC transporter transmembrane domain-containing protein [Intestinimonas sp.]